MGNRDEKGKDKDKTEAVEDLELDTEQAKKVKGGAKKAK